MVGLELGLQLARLTISSTATSTWGAQPLGGARFATEPWIRRTRQRHLDMIALFMAGIAVVEIFLVSTMTERQQARGRISIVRPGLPSTWNVAMG